MRFVEKIKSKKIPSRSLGFLQSIVVYDYLTIPLNSEPALKVTTFIAGILIFCEGF